MKEKYWNYLQDVLTIQERDKQMNERKVSVEDKDN